MVISHPIHPLHLSPATVLQTVALGETVEPDDSTVLGRGAAALRALGRHAASRAGRPRPLSIPRPQPADAARQRQRAGNPRSACLCCRCSRPLQAPAGRRTPPGLPARFQRVGAGLRPHCTTGPWAGLFRFRAGNGLRLPLRQVGRVGTAQLAGLRLNAWPHVLRHGTRSGLAPAAMPTHQAVQLGVCLQRQPGPAT